MFQAPKLRIQPQPMFLPQKAAPRFNTDDDGNGVTRPANWVTWRHPKGLQKHQLEPYLWDPASKKLIDFNKQISSPEKIKPLEPNQKKTRKF